MHLLMIFIIFSFVCYGCVNMLVYFSGPMGIFEYIRKVAHSISDRFGELFDCPACCSTWVSFFLSALNLILVPSIAFTPFNVILGGTGLWWLIVLLDGLFGSGITWFLFKIEDFMTSFNNEGHDDVIKLKSEDISNGSKN